MRLRSRATPRERLLDPRWPVRDVIDSLLSGALPDEVHALVPRLVGEVAAREFIAAHARKRWGELSEGEGNLIAREAGLVARDVLNGSPPCRAVICIRSPPTSTPRGPWSDLR